MTAAKVIQLAPATGTQPLPLCVRSVMIITAATTSRNRIFTSMMLLRTRDMIGLISCAPWEIPIWVVITSAAEKIESNQYHIRDQIILLNTRKNYFGRNSQ
jgi:hypothetical protein